MQVLPNFVDMKKHPVELKEDALPYDLQKHAQAVYPYGLGICLENEQLDRLNLDGDADVGDTIHLQAIGKVTSASKNDTTEGVRQRLEIQLTHIALSDDHEEVAAAPSRKRPGHAAFYK